MVSNPKSHAEMRALPEKYYPPVNRGMTELDRDFFQKKFNIVAAFFPDSKCIQSFCKSKTFRSDLLQLRGLMSINKSQADPSKKVVLLNDSVTSTNLEDVKEHLNPETYQFLVDNKAEIQPYELNLDYSFWKVDEILSAVLPEELLNDIPSSFTTVGHIAHLNLNDEFLPYKHFIGQVILDKNVKITTVVNKVNTIATKFRTFPMEVIAGEEKFDVQQQESNCTFNFNFRDVYWNSRLQTEHLRLTSLFHKGELICDAMAGVGPFAVPAAKNRKAIVLANDLNPSSYKSLCENTALNNVTKLTSCYNLDGAEFIKKSPELLVEFYNKNNQIVLKKNNRHSKKRKVADQNAETSTNNVTNEEIIPVPKHISHYVMNLPDSAITFLGNYMGVLNNKAYQEFIKDYEGFQLPKIHVYCFEKWAPTENPSEEELQKRVQVRIEENMQYKFNEGHLSFHMVRKVSPTKIMFCVSFELPDDLAFKEI